MNPTLDILRPLLLFLLLLLLHLRHSLSSPHRLLSTPTRPMATYRALLSLKSSLDDSRLSALSALRLLNLSNNVFNRTFPSELSNLTNLRVLDLYNNNLTGVLPVSVATFHCISQCRNTIFKLSYNLSIMNEERQMEDRVFRPSILRCLSQPYVSRNKERIG
ncbi:hypothetical protein ACLB2K_053208 [Fragaria x ananassa]